MEQTALRPKPMPGQQPGDDTKPDPDPDPGPAPGPGSGTRRPHAARRRGRRLTTALLALFAGTVLVLSGVGLGTVGATVIGMSKLAELRRQSGPGAPGGPPGQTSGSPSSAARPGATGSSGLSAPSVSSPPPVPGRTAAPAGAILGVEAVDAQRVGALVVGVHVPGPGYTAGLVRGDVLLAYDETRIDTAADLARAVADTRPGTRVTLTVRHRSGGFQQLTVVPGVTV